MKLSLSQEQRERAREVAQHEMGHYVIARAMGFQTGDVTLEITGPRLGHRGSATISLSRPVKTIEEIQAYLEGRVIVLYAGAAAQTLPMRSAPSKKVDVKRAIEIIRRLNQGAEQDHAKARELVNLLRNIMKTTTGASNSVATDDELNVLDEKLFNRSVELVERYAETIIGLGGNLSNRVIAPNEMVTLVAADLEGNYPGP